jgi:hypothetical protein
MKRIKIMGLCVVAVFALSAMAASSASAALPNVILHLFALCVKATKTGKTYNGHFSAKTCAPSSKVATNGKYELASAVGDKGTSKSKTSTLYSYIPKSESEPWTGGTVVGTVVCKKSAGTTEIINNEQILTSIKFEDCSSEGKKCTNVKYQGSETPTTGDILTYPLIATLRLYKGKVVSRSEPQPGVSYNTENLDASFNCEGLAVETSGDAVGEITGDIESANKDSKDTLTVNPATGEPGISFTEEGKEGEEGKDTLALLVSKITPPGVNLPGGENTTQELKGGAIGVYPQSDFPS